MVMPPMLIFNKQKLMIFPDRVASPSPSVSYLQGNMREHVIATALGESREQQ